MRSPELILASYSCARRLHIVRLTRALPRSVSMAFFKVCSSASLRMPTLCDLPVGTRSVILSFSKVMTNSSSEMPAISCSSIPTMRPTPWAGYTIHSLVLKPWRWLTGFLLAACWRAWAARSATTFGVAGSATRWAPPLPIAAAGMARTLLAGVAGWACAGAVGFGSAMGFDGAVGAFAGAVTMLAAAGFDGFFATGAGGVTGFLAMLPLRIASGLAALGAAFAVVLAVCALAPVAFADGRAAALRSGDLDFFVAALAAVFLRVILLVPLATSDCIPNSYMTASSAYSSRPPAAAAAPPMVPTALLVAEPWPSHRLAPSLYGLAV